MRTDEKRPVLSGLVALVAVGLTVGMIVGLVALAGTKLLGVGGAEEASAETTSQQSMYLPKPQETETDSGPLITLAPAPDDGTDSEVDPDVPTESPSESEKAEKEIALSAGQTSVSPMGRIDLTGVYPGGEGAILMVQRLEGGRWDDFGVTISVSNETFSTYVQTGQPGVNRFRVADTDSDMVSNEIRVTIG